MTSMKYIILTALNFTSLSSFASGGGGGILMKVPSGSNSELSPEIVFNLGQSNGSVKFAYGQLVDKKWQIQKLEMLEADLLADSSVMEALQDSKSLNSWVEIK